MKSWFIVFIFQHVQHELLLEKQTWGNIGGLCKCIPINHNFKPVIITTIQCFSWELWVLVLQPNRETKPTDANSTPWIGNFRHTPCSSDIFGPVEFYGQPGGDFRIILTFLGLFLSTISSVNIAHCPAGGTRVFGVSLIWKHVWVDANWHPHEGAQVTNKILHC